MRSLHRLRCGERGKVNCINCKGPLRRRIMDMGITKGTTIEVKRIAPFGDPIEICVRGYKLSIRKKEAENIILE
ncbi:MAG TPA: ferrous iron transport protein A [Acholeplasmataceae bacterium]|nr:ferrous iron transport protein A [Acholeplasmataceae bacterium]